MKVYIGLRGFPKGKGIGWEFGDINNNPYSVGMELYYLGLDGEETAMVEYDTSTGQRRWLSYKEKFAYGKAPQNLGLEGLRREEV